MGDNAAVDDYQGLVEVADQGPEGLYEYFSERGWGDGLPLVAPTHERVEESLSHADGDPDEPVAMLAPRDGVATRRAVAVNAVLAGCRPEYLPVVLTAVRALGHQQVNLRGVNATTHPVAPLSIVHGEVVDALGSMPVSVHSGRGPGPTPLLGGPSGWSYSTWLVLVPVPVTPPPRGSRPSTPTA